MITFEDYLKKYPNYNHYYANLNGKLKAILKYSYNAAAEAIAQTRLWIPVPANRIQLGKVKKEDVANAYFYQRLYKADGVNIIDTTTDYYFRNKSACDNPCLYLMKGFFAMLKRTGCCGDMASCASFFILRELGRLCHKPESAAFSWVWKNVEVNAIKLDGAEHFLCRMELPLSKKEVARRIYGSNTPNQGDLHRFYQLKDWYIDPWIQEAPVSQYFAHRSGYGMKTGYKQQALDTKQSLGKNLIRVDNKKGLSLAGSGILKSIFIDNGSEAYDRYKGSLPGNIKSLRGYVTFPSQTSGSVSGSASSRYQSRHLRKIFLQGFTCDATTRKIIGVLNKCKNDRQKDEDEHKIICDVQNIHRHLKAGIYYFFGKPEAKKKREIELAQFLLEMQVQAHYAQNPPPNFSEFIRKKCASEVADIQVQRKRGAIGEIGARKRTLAVKEKYQKLLIEASKYQPEYQHQMSKTPDRYRISDVDTMEALFKKILFD